MVYKHIWINQQLLSKYKGMGVVLLRVISIDSKEINNKVFLDQVHMIWIKIIWHLLQIVIMGNKITEWKTLEVKIIKEK